ncbi:MAG: acetyl-CoA carboxylase biotin carboxyl carrier protein [Sphingomonadaceae bacterium]|nr:acetyl-CoA carboxylase biotin carboxyl carrier protein [Sphingomonadaceae bacterium]
MTDKPAAMQVDAALVRQLAKLLDESRLTEIEVEDGGRRIRVARNMIASAPAAATQATPCATTIAAPAPSVESGHSVKSPMVGTVYLSSEPGSKPFASVGDTIAEGQTLVIIEAMKVMNPIVSPRAGKIIRVCVENGQPVEFDQPLVVIE